MAREANYYGCYLGQNYSLTILINVSFLIIILTLIITQNKIKNHLGSLMICSSNHHAISINLGSSTKARSHFI